MLSRRIKPVKGIIIEKRKDASAGLLNANLLNIITFIKMLPIINRIEHLTAVKTS